MRRADFCVSKTQPVFVSVLACGFACACSAAELSSPKDVAGFNPSAETSVTVVGPPAPSPKPLRAPVGVVPTDAQISTAVFRQFERDPGIDDRDVYVSTNDGIVQLSGAVHDILSKERLARVAATVRGVRSVSDQVRLEVPARDDGSVVRDVANALRADPVTAPLRLVQSCSGGVVRLSGRVGSFQQETIAERLAKRVRGVRAIDDDVKVVTWLPRTDSIVTHDVESRLEWDPLVDHSLVAVETREGTVFLRGQVGSFAELARASSDAWVRGVRTVDATGLGVDPGMERRELRASDAEAPTDTEIARAIKEAAIYDPRVKSTEVEPRVKGGAVTLLGIVDDPVAKEAADSIARYTAGVVAVRDLIQVSSLLPKSDRGKLERIESALAIDSVTDHSAIGVEVAHDTARLSGVVDSYMVRSEAEELAGAVGVATVEDRLYVEQRR
ncbi:MAG TPA: BON domain-containing protein [Polyangiaceae bacterium]|nr:BON domain-containing protein [Polyangiaceae bacterium]